MRLLQDSISKDELLIAALRGLRCLLTTKYPFLAEKPMTVSSLAVSAPLPLRFYIHVICLFVSSQSKREAALVSEWKIRAFFCSRCL